MTAPTYRLITALLALTLLASGCTLGRSRSSTSPREEASPSALSADVETLRHENDQLREQQQALRKQLDEMHDKLARSQEEQRRFRESMTTNFDLLEQSVALTLSKTITADMSGVPADGKPAAGAQHGAKAEVTGPQALAAPTEVKAPAMAAAPKAAQAPRQASAPKAVAAPKPAEAPAAAVARDDTARDDTAMSAAAATPAMLRMDEPRTDEPAQDPDLLPPQSPRTLSAHQEAKPLYEKGFALFARKEYDQAIIVFQNFLNRFPDDIYSDNAQFWIAESFLNLNRSREAEDAYRAVLRNYEHRSTLEGYKTPDAIFRLGQLAQRHGDARQARQYFQVASERFPDSSAGRKAQRELDSAGINTAAR